MHRHIVIPEIPESNSFFRPRESTYFIAMRVKATLITPTNTVCIKAESVPVPVDLKSPVHNTL